MALKGHISDKEIFAFAQDLAKKTKSRRIDSTDRTKYTWAKKEKIHDYIDFYISYLDNIIDIVFTIHDPNRRSCFIIRLIRDDNGKVAEVKFYPRISDWRNDVPLAFTKDIKNWRVAFKLWAQKPFTHKMKGDISKANTLL